METISGLWYLVKADGVEHEAKVHPRDGDIGDDGEPKKLPKRNMLGCRITASIGDNANNCSYSKMEPS